MPALLLERAGRPASPPACRWLATTVALPPLTDQATAGGESGQSGRGAEPRFLPLGWRRPRPALRIARRALHGRGKSAWDQVSGARFQVSGNREQSSESLWWRYGKPVAGKASNAHWRLAVGEQASLTPARSPWRCPGRRRCTWRPAHACRRCAPAAGAPSRRSANPRRRADGRRRWRRRSG